jgi:undecaprenyl-diphosphatase
MAGARGLPLRHALTLGLLQGPTELLPVSSSAHTTLLPWFAGWPYGKLDPRLRKSFEVALHAGTAAALLAYPPDARFGGRASLLAPALIPPALVGYTLGGQIERRLGTPTTIAVGLLAGSVAMTAGGRRTGDTRPVESAGIHDGLALGLAQALALIPGVSRSGATLAAGRTRGFSREDADLLSWRVGLPVIAGAAALQGSRLAREGVPREMALPLAAGSASAFVSTLAAARLLSRKRRAALLASCVVYRTGLALLVVRRMRKGAVRSCPTNGAGSVVNP